MSGRCRACGQRLPADPLLTLENMPRQAQHLPSEADLALDRGMDLRLLQCEDCGLVQLPGAPVPYYRDVIRATGLSGEMRQFRLRQFADFVERFGLREKKVVEIGCGSGELLALMRDAGADASGLEHDAALVRHCAARGLPAARGFVSGPRTRLPGGPFEAFFTLNYLEHLPRPGAFLEGLRGNLCEGAPGLLEVPSFDMMRREGLFSEFIPDHLMYFTASSLRTLLEGRGFEVLGLREIWYGYILSAEVRCRRRIDAAPFERHRARLARDLAAFVGRHPAGRVAAWGAGHQALALLSLAGLGGKIRYVVDVAPFKQGRFTPATHIPIVAPERLVADPVEAIVVMAAGYSDEVAALVRERHGSRVEIAIVRKDGLEIRPRADTGEIARG